MQYPGSLLRDLGATSLVICPGGGGVGWRLSSRGEGKLLTWLDLKSIKYRLIYEGKVHTGTGHEGTVGE